MRLREFEHQHTATGFKYAAHRAQRSVFVGHITQAIGEGDAVEGVDGERQRFGIDLSDIDIEVGAFDDDSVTAYDVDCCVYIGE